jgi:hypothetical protein
VTVALAATAIVVVALLFEVSLPWLDRRAERRRALREARRRGVPMAYDPGRERRAEQRARELLRSCVNDEEWSMYRDLGFIRVWGGRAGGPASGGHADGAGGFHADGPSGGTGGFGSYARHARDLRGVPYAYLVYPHKPIVAYLPQTGQLLNEYCVEFPDETRPYGSPRLPDSDDVLAKWMALKGDEGRLIAEANMHLPGRQLDPARVSRDIWRLGRWERERLERASTIAPVEAPRAHPASPDA